MIRERTLVMTVLARACLYIPSTKYSTWISENTLQKVLSLPNFFFFLTPLFGSYCSFRLHRFLLCLRSHLFLFSFLDWNLILPVEIRFLSLQQVSSPLSSKFYYFLIQIFVNTYYVLERHICSYQLSPRGKNYCGLKIKLYKKAEWEVAIARE